MSPLSDIYSSSIYEGEVINSLPYLQSDDLSAFPSELTASQQTVTSNTDLSFTQPISIPPSLQHVGPDRRKTWILFDNMSKKEFLEWWFETQSGVSQSQQSKGKKLQWDGVGYHSKVWAKFDQVAHYITGEPKAMCKQCGRIIDHPNHSSNKTSALWRHLKADKCQQYAAGAMKQPTIQQSMQQQAVYLYYIIPFIQSFILIVFQKARITSTGPDEEPFTNELWEHEIITTIAVLRLPFSIIEHPQMQKLICLAHRAPSVPHFPSARTVRRWLAGEVKQQQQTVLQQLPPNAKLSIALDCWTSPFRQAFMQLLGTFLTQSGTTVRFSLVLNHSMEPTLVQT